MIRREQIPPPAIYLVGFLVGVALQVAFPVGGLPAALYVGMALGVGTIWSLALLPVVLAGIHYDVIPREERHLQARFGAEYRSYCKRVRRWL